MASIVFSRKQPIEPSHVDVGEDPTKRVTIVLGERTITSLIALANERRAVLRERVDEGTPVVGPVETVEEALLDLIGGVGASGGASWFYHNFPVYRRTADKSNQAPELAHSTLLVFHHHNEHFRCTHAFVGWHGDTDHIRTLWHTKRRPTSKAFGGTGPPRSFMLAATNYDIVGEITGRNKELQDTIRDLPSPTTSEMYEEARRRYEHNMASAYRSQSPIGVVVQHPAGVVFHLVHTGNQGQLVVERL